MKVANMHLAPGWWQPPTYFGSCDCGWVGRSRTRPRWAFRDAIRHERRDHAS